jgi:uncharacterized protein involved in exopolysaccharide biosynthesis
MSNIRHMREFLEKILRNKKTVAVVYLGCIITILLMLLVQESFYQSEAKLLVRVGRENDSLDAALTTPNVLVSVGREREINSELSILLSKFLAESVVDQVGLDYVLGKSRSTGSLQKVSNTLQLWVDDSKNTILGFFQKNKGDVNIPIDSFNKETGVKEIQKKLKVEAVPNSHIINVFYKDQDSIKAKEILEVIIDIYLKHHIKVFGSQTTPHLLDLKAKELLSQVKEKEIELTNYMQSNNLVSIDQQKGILLDQISDIQKVIDQDYGGIKSSEAKIALLKKSIIEREGTKEINRVSGKTNHAADAIKEKLVDLRLQERDHKMRYPYDTSTLNRLHEQIELAQKLLKDEEMTQTEVMTGIDETYQSILFELDREKANLEGVKARRKSLENELSTKKTNMHDLVTHEYAIRRIQNEIDILKREYTNYVTNMERAMIASTLDSHNITNVSIVQPPTLPLIKSGIGKKNMFVLGNFFALFCSAFLAFVIDKINNKIRTYKDAQDLGFEVIGTIPGNNYKSDRMNKV